MDYEDLAPPLLVRSRHGDAPIEAPGTQQSLVEHFGTVGGGEDDHGGVGLKAVHFREDLVERLFALVVAAEVGRSGT